MFKIVNLFIATLLTISFTEIAQAESTTSLTVVCMDVNTIKILTLNNSGLATNPTKT